ncbi:MAG: hypothetical protein OXT09_31710, partial [Myxococcales bacterium]|nr:hypothetical protein [Myxococcales bacterium]
ARKALRMVVRRVMAVVAPGTMMRGAVTPQRGCEGRAGGGVHAIEALRDRLRRDRTQPPAAAAGRRRSLDRLLDRLPGLSDRSSVRSFVPGLSDRSSGILRWILRLDVVLAADGDALAKLWPMPATSDDITMINLPGATMPQPETSSAT